MYPLDSHVDKGSPSATASDRYGSGRVAGALLMYASLEM